MGIAFYNMKMIQIKKPQKRLKIEQKSESRGLTLEMIEKINIDIIHARHSNKLLHSLY